MCKKLLGMCLLMCIVYLTLGTAGVQETAAFQEEGMQFTGKKMFELTSDKAISGRPNSEAKLDLTQVNILPNGDINLTGSMHCEDKSVPFSVSGKAYKSNYFQSLVFDATDLTGNFDIVHLAITSDESCLYDRSLLERNTPVLQLYVLKDDTDLIAFELPINHFGMDNKDILDVESISVSDIMLDHWWVKVFKPEIKESNFISQERMDIVIMAESSSTLTVSYNHAPAPGTEYRISIKSLMNINDNEASNSDTYRLDVASQAFYYDGVYMADDPLLYIVNCVSTVEMRNASINEINENAFNKVDWHTISGAPSAPVSKWGVTLGIGYGPISGGLSWSTTGSKMNDPGGRDVFMPSEFVQGVRTEYGRYLNKVGDRHILSTEKIGMKTSMPKKINIRYEFAVSFFNTTTIVIPYRSLSTEATYY